MQPVAATIVARNYIPFARTLCASFLKHHPEGRFFVLLVDQLDGAFDPGKEQFELVQLDSINLPLGELFLYQYSILELSTAVKPYLLRYLLDEYSLESVLYLDPDLFITAPLATVYEALSRSSIVLTPHMLEPPPEDGKTPTETDIMLSGVYNLGFLGVRNDASVARLLDWWGRRLAFKCVVDLPNALFVDQRWMDLAPSYFDGVEILKDPAVNVAYWNLHERKLQHVDSVFLVNGKPLAFFHFSGFNPNNLDTLSKHQTRHRPSDSTALAEITRMYAGDLLSNGYTEFSRIPVAFNGISNGVRLGKLSQFVIRRAIEKGLGIPSPRSQPDAFCRFLMTPSHLFDQRAIAPLLVALEHYRPDVKAAYPKSFEAHGYVDDIRRWVQSSGGKEEGIGELFDLYGHLLDRVDVVKHALTCWRRRSDLQAAFPDAFTSIEGSENYAHWIEQYGTAEDAFLVGDGKTFLALRKGLLKALMLYLQDAGLQREFKFLFVENDRVRYVNWLYAEACPRNMVTPEEVAWFDGFAEGVPNLLAAIVLGHGSWLQASLAGGGTMFNMRQLRDMLTEAGVHATGNSLFQLYTHPLGREVSAQAEQHYYHSPELRNRFDTVFDDGKHAETFVEVLVNQAQRGKSWLAGGSALVHITGHGKGMANRLRVAAGLVRSTHKIHSVDGQTDLNALRAQLFKCFSVLQSGRTGVNLAGYFHSPTGMGESVRSMSRTLAAGGIECKEIPLPSTHLGPWVDLGDLLSGQLLAAHNPASRVNIIVANGDEYPHVRGRLPHAFWQKRKSIGYWVWETECLPGKHADTHGLTEIWTPSEYSGNAIRKAVEIPVRVVPHVLDFDEIDRVKPDRRRFGLPEDETIFGFFFDSKSVIERKNPLALLHAFRQAFGPHNKKALLVLKASSPEVTPFEFSQLKMAANGLNVIWVTDSLSRSDALTLMKSLDVYVSLHRSEGFGLTMAEAMAMGKPVVASAYSGNVDYMTASDACLVRTPVITTDRDHGPYPAGTRWGDPDVEQAAEYLAALMNAEMRSRIGSAASRAIRERLNSLEVGRRVTGFIGGPET
jgi:glycosyltransferase involved in cell wall biosynthesis